MIYKIKEATPTITSTNKPMKKLVLETENNEVVRVNIFSDFPHYAELREGSTIDGEIRKNDKGYDNLYSNEIKPKGNPNFKTQQMEKVMDKKSELISKAQDNKELGIKIASTLRMAVDVATSLTSDQWQGTTMQEEIKYWREWFWLEWSNTEDMKPF